MNINFLWLPILFVVHDLEELILVPKWVLENKETLDKKKRPLFGNTENASIFAIGVLEELLILIAVAIYADYFKTTIVFFYVTLAYTIHLFLHIIFCLQYKKYVPGVITAIIQIPILTKIIYDSYPNNTSVGSMLITTCFTFALVFINVLFLHKIMNKLSHNPKTSLKTYKD